MADYFSFQKLITTRFVKAIYFVGFLALIAGGLGLIGWAGMRLHDANISRDLGWRYVAVGAAAVLVGNLAWRILCEFWIVLFNIHSHLAAIDHGINWSRSSMASVDGSPSESKATEEDRPSKVLRYKKEEYQSPRHDGVLGLS
jgi:Domain of unknown function (DUF4282)